MVASCMLSGSCLFILGLGLLSCVTHASPISAGKKLIHFGNILMFSMEKKFLILLLGWINIRLWVYILLTSSYVCNYDPIFWKYIFQQKTFLFDQLTRLYLYSCMWQIAKKFFCYDFDWDPYLNSQVVIK